MVGYTRRQALRRGIGIAAAGAALPALAACGSSEEKSGAATAAGTKLRTVRHQLGWLHGVEWGGTYIAIDRGYHRAEGQRLELSPGGPQTNAESRLAAGRADVGIVYGVGVALANKEGADLTIIGGHLQKSPAGVASLADDPIRRPEDLAGKRIGVPTNSVASMDAFLAANGVSKKDVKYVPVQDSIGPLANGQVDGFYTYITELGALAARKIPYHFMYRSEFSETDMPDLIGVSRRTLESDRDMVVRFLRAEIRGWQDFVANPTPAIKAAVNDYGKPIGLKEPEQRFQAEQYVALVKGAPIVEDKGVLWLSDRTRAGIRASAKAAGAPLQDAAFDDSVLREAFGGRNRL